MWLIFKKINKLTKNKDFDSSLQIFCNRNMQRYEWNFFYRAERCILRDVWWLYLDLELIKLCKISHAVNWNEQRGEGTGNIVSKRNIFKNLFTQIKIIKWKIFTAFVLNELTYQKRSGRFLVWQNPSWGHEYVFSYCYRFGTGHFLSLKGKLVRFLFNCTRSK